jgi:hypothetical protein
MGACCQRAWGGDPSSQGATVDSCRAGGGSSGGGGVGGGAVCGNTTLNR